MPFFWPSPCLLVTFTPLPMAVGMATPPRGIVRATMPHGPTATRRGPMAIPPVRTRRLTVAPPGRDHPITTTAAPIPVIREVPTTVRVTPVITTGIDLNPKKKAAQVSARPFFFKGSGRLLLLLLFLLPALAGDDVFQRLLGLQLLSDELVLPQVTQGLGHLQDLALFGLQLVGGSGLD